MKQTLRSSVGSVLSGVSRLVWWNGSGLCPNIIDGTPMVESLKITWSLPPVYSTIRL